MSSPFFRGCDLRGTVSLFLVPTVIGRSIGRVLGLVCVTRTLVALSVSGRFGRTGCLGVARRSTGIWRWSLCGSCPRVLTLTCRSIVMVGWCGLRQTSSNGSLGVCHQAVPPFPQHFPQHLRRMRFTHQSGDDNHQTGFGLRVRFTDPVTQFSDLQMSHVQPFCGYNPDKATGAGDDQNVA